MKSQIKSAKLTHMEKIKQYLCPDCGGELDQAMSPGGATGAGEVKHKFTHWDFHCLNKECGKIWRVPKTLYETAFGFWPE